MRNFIADYALAHGLALIKRYRELPEGRHRAALLALASFLNLIRQLARPTDRAFTEEVVTNG